MIEAKELRIGNYVWFNDAPEKIGLAIVERISNDIVHTSSGRAYVKELEPIHLTEKRLIDFGMEMPINEDPIFEYGKGKYKNCFNDFKKTSQSLIDASFEINVLNFWADSNGFWFNIMMDYTKIEYVHQFQNLYHALTGKELTITK